MTGDTLSTRQRIRDLAPGAVKKPLVRSYWAARQLSEDVREYTGELIGHVPSHAVRLGWYRAVCGVAIGRESSIHRGCRLYAPWRIAIGANSVINFGVTLDGRRVLRIGDNVSISEGVVILTLGHDMDDPEFGLRGGPVVIGDRVFIGAHARILPGVTIGEGGVVAAAAVVTHDVEPYTVVAGVPARYVRERRRDLTYRLSYRKRFG